MKRVFLPVVFTVLFLSANCSCLAQQAKIDSLRGLVKKDKEDTCKAPHLNSLSWEYAKTGSNDSALKCAQSAIRLCEKLLNENADAKIQHSAKKSEATSYSTIGIIFLNQGNYPDALKNHALALNIRKAINDTKGLSASYNNIGLVCKDQGNYAEALKNYFASLTIRETLGDKKGAAECYNNIGNIYCDEGNYKEGLKNYQADLNLREALGDKLGNAGTYNNIGNIYANEENYAEALKNYFAALEIFKVTGSKIGISTSYDNIGSIYNSQGNYEEALKNHFASLKIEEEIGDKADISGSYLNIGGVLLNQKKYKEAGDYLLKAKNLATEVGNKKWMMGCYGALAKLDSAKGDFKGAFENQKLFVLYTNLLDNEQIQKKSMESQMTFDFEKKEAAIKAEQDKKDSVTAAEEKRQRLFLWFVLALALSITIIAIVIFIGLQQSKRAKKLIELQRDKISEQKEIVENQKTLVEEKQKEIVDSITYAKRIQLTLLANKQLLQNNLPEHFVLFKPKAIVSGDFYWATQRDNKFYIAACDCTGHGVPGAFMSLLNISFLNEAVNEKHIVKPNEILNHVRKRLIENMDGGQDGMDAILMCFEKTGQGTEITYSSANNSPALIRNGELFSLGADKMPVGKGEKTEPFTLREVSSQKGDSLYLLTDGFADQFGGSKGKKFKSRQLNELILSISNLPAAQQSALLNERFEDWKGNFEQVDDMLVIGIRI